MKQDTSNMDAIIYLMGVKLNNYKQPSSEVERNIIMELGKKWIEEHPGEHVNFY